MEGKHRPDPTVLANGLEAVGEGKQDPEVIPRSAAEPQ